MYRRVNPSSTLREENSPRLGGHSMRNSIRSKLGLESWEMLHHQRRQESIFTEREQILLVKSVDVGFSVLVDDTVRDDDGSTLVCGTDPIQRETTRKTGDRTEQTLESLRQVVRDIVFVHLDHCPPGSFFVQKLCFSTDADDARIVSGRGYQAIERLGRHRL